ncbi:hypothetical protein ACI0FM_16210 [Paenochrobactrum sp. BZR 588]
MNIVAFNLLDGKDGRHDHRYNDRDRSGQKRFPGARSLDDGAIKIPQKLLRLQFRKFMAEHPATTVVMEACGSAHYWAREIAKYGHEVKLIAPQYVRPFVKRQKNDAADAEAIFIAAQQPEMRFIIPKMEEQQAKALLFHGRERLVR